MRTGQFVAVPGGPLNTGARLGKYQIVRRLGAGGMGAVYEAVHAEIGKRVAIKVLSSAVAAIPEARARFLREAQLTSKVRHPHAVDVTDMGTEGDQTFLVMELLDGEDLAAHLDRVGQMQVDDLVDVMLPVCSAVTAAHAVGIIHRDIKPQNIFLARGVHGTVPKVLDFGISKSRDGSAPQPLTGTDAVLGTPYYLAPEQVADNRTSSPASDQYALGIVLYECLTGVRPFQADSLFLVMQAIVAGAPVPPSTHRPDLDPHLESIVLRAMDVDPARRFPSVTSLAIALLPYASARAHVLWRDALGSPQAETLDDAALRGAPPGGRPAGGRVVTPGARGSRPGVARPPTPGGARGSRPGARHARTPAPLPPVMVRAPSRAPLVLSLVAAAAIAAGIIWVATGQSAGEESRPALAPAARAPVAPPAPRTYEVRVAVEPATARIVLDGSDVGRGSFERTFTADGKTHTLEISANEFESETVSFVDAPPPPRIMLVARPAPAPAPAPPRPPARRHAVGSVHRPAPEPPEPQRGFNGAPVIE